jgi:hypothetical protein
MIPGSTILPRASTVRSAGMSGVPITNCDMRPPLATTPPWNLPASVTTVALRT